MDQDSTIIESHKREALPTYQGEPGYQPMLAVWAETDLILVDQFRDGNVPPMQEPLRVAQAAFAALPATVEEFYYRGDAACHEHNLIACRQRFILGKGSHAHILCLKRIGGARVRVE